MKTISILVGLVAVVDSSEVSIGEDVLATIGTVLVDSMQTRPPPNPSTDYEIVLHAPPSKSKTSLADQKDDLIATEKEKTKEEKTKEEKREKKKAKKEEKRKKHREESKEKKNKRDGGDKNDKKIKDDEDKKNKRNKPKVEEEDPGAATNPPRTNTKAKKQSPPSPTTVSDDTDPAAPGPTPATPNPPPTDDSPPDPTPSTPGDPAPTPADPAPAPNPDTVPTPSDPAPAPSPDTVPAPADPAPAPSPDTSPTPADPAPSPDTAPPPAAQTPPPTTPALDPAIAFLVSKFPLPYPFTRFTVWNELGADEVAVASEGLMYIESDWNNLALNDVEMSTFDQLGANQQSSISALGMDAEMWDCYLNHYDGLFWEELQDEGVAQYYEALGWNEDNWDGDGEEPATELAYWEDLTAFEQEMAYKVCFFENSWDFVSLSDWEF